MMILNTVFKFRKSMTMGTAENTRFVSTAAWEKSGKKCDYCYTNWIFLRTAIMSSFILTVIYVQ